MKNFLLKEIEFQKSIAIFRITLGVFFIYHGFGKFFDPSKWVWLGKQTPLIGSITFLQAILGFLASFSEFIGGIFLIFGVFSRFFCILLAITMFVACHYHYQKGDNLNLLCSI